MQRPLILAFTLLFAILTWSSCKKSSTGIGTEVDYSAIGEIDYNAHVQPLLNDYQDMLSDAGLLPSGLSMRSWSNLIAGADDGEVIIPFDAANSRLVEFATKTDSAVTLAPEKLDFLIRWIDEGARNGDGAVPYATSTNRLYVCSQGEGIVQIIDMDARVVMRTVHLTDFGIPASAKPHFIAFTPDKQFWFVSCIDNQVNKVLKFRVDDNSLVGDVTTDIPALMSHHPREDVLYVSRFMLNNQTTSIFAVNSVTMAPIANGNDGEILLPPGQQVAHAMKLSISGDYVYTASFTEDAFLVIDHSTGAFADVIGLGLDAAPLQLSVAPDDQRAYVSCIGTGEVVVVNLSDPNDRHLDGRYSVGGQPWHSVFSPDGNTLYVANLASNQVNVLNVNGATFTSIGAGDGSDGLSQPHGIEISPDGRYLFVGCRNTNGNYAPRTDFGDNAMVGTVVVIDTQSNAIVKVLEIENFGSGMGALSL